MVVVCSYWCLPIMSTFGHHFVLQIAAWKRHLPFSWSFFVTSDVCTTGGWVGAVITTPGAIHDGSGGRHSALFTPKRQSHPHSAAVPLILHQTTVRKIQLWKPWSFFWGFTVLCFCLHSFKPNLQHMYSWQTFWRHFCVLSWWSKANRSGVWWILFLVGIHNFLRLWTMLSNKHVFVLFKLSAFSEPSWVIWLNR